MAKTLPKDHLDAAHEQWVAWKTQQIEDDWFSYVQNQHEGMSMHEIVETSGLTIEAVRTGINRVWMFLAHRDLITDDTPSEGS